VRPDRRISPLEVVPLPVRGVTALDSAESRFLFVVELPRIPPLGDDKRLPQRGFGVTLVLCTQCRRSMPTISHFR
jgi:hypothetical protein